MKDMGLGGVEGGQTIVEDLQPTQHDGEWGAELVGDIGDHAGGLVCWGVNMDLPARPGSRLRAGSLGGMR